MKNAKSSFEAVSDSLDQMCNVYSPFGTEEDRAEAAIRTPQIIELHGWTVEEFTAEHNRLFDVFWIK